MKSQQVKIPKKLIEVALPLDAINTASAREKSIRHGHPSTLHLWWARRPLATARAILFAQLVNDPGFEVGDGFRRGLNKQDAELERTRLFNILEQLVLWENSNNAELLEAAHTEIMRSWKETCKLNKDHPNAAILFNPEKLPESHDPFAGGGAIPLEAQRLGIKSYASDLNPVAVVINKAMIEIPQRFIDTIPVRPLEASPRLANGDGWSNSEGLAEDIRYYGRLLHSKVSSKISQYYPQVKLSSDQSEKPRNVIAWLWVRTVKSPNPAYSNVKVPLASTFILSKAKGKEAYISPVISGGNYHFEVIYGKPPESASSGTKTSRGANFRCLLSGSPIEPDYIKQEGKAGRLSVKLMAVVVEGDRGRLYIAPSTDMEELATKVQPGWVPETPLPNDPRSFWTLNYGLAKYKDLFTNRQLMTLDVFSETLDELLSLIEADALRAGLDDDSISFDNGGKGAKAYSESIVTYLAFAIDKLCDYNSAVCSWHNGRETIRNTYTRQTIPMAWDFAEANPISNSTGSFLSAVEQISKVVQGFKSAIPGCVQQIDAQSQTLTEGKIVSTDPPYYDNIGYADLSDFFYVWLRKNLRKVYPELFATLTSPKQEELVANPYRQGSKSSANVFFLDGMTEAMHKIAGQAHPAFPISIYYAFKQSETTDSGTSSTGWETFLAAVMKAGLVVTGTWPVRTELSNRMVGSGTNALASSIVLVCRVRDPDASSISRKEFLRELREELVNAVDAMIGGSRDSSPVAPVDLAQAVIGPGMAIFSKYASVLEADGSTMSVHTALTLINRILTEDKGEFDNDTLFCLDWFEQHGWVNGDFGSADVLARAKGTSVEHARIAGVIEATAGKVRLMRPTEYTTVWTSQNDHHIPSWELLHYLSSQFESGGIEKAANLLAMVDPSKHSPSSVRKLAYQLYTICERAGKPEDARRYNNLILAWDDITRTADSIGRAGTQANLFEAV